MPVSSWEIIAIFTIKITNETFSLDLHAVLFVYTCASFFFFFMYLHVTFLMKYFICILNKKQQMFYLEDNFFYESL